MSNWGRVLLIAGAVAVVVAAFAIARPGDDDGDGGAPTTTATTPTATAPSAPEPPPDGPTATRIELRGGAPAGGVRSIDAARGDRVRIVVASDAPDEIHLHGYDITRAAAPGSPARFSFVADIEGIFEIESHEAEHAGREPLIARLVVEPS